MTRRWGRAEAVLAPKTGRSSGERPTGGATPAASPVAPRSSPTPRAATIGSTQPGTHDRPASDTAEATGAAAPPARVGARGSPAPSTDPTDPPARKAQAGSAPPSTPATTANDPPSPESARAPNLANAGGGTPQRISEPYALETSRDKPRHLLHTPAAFTLRPLDDDGLHHRMLARPDRPASDAVRVPRVMDSHSGFLPTPPHNGAVAIGSWLASPSATGDSHPQATRHARRTCGEAARRPPLRVTYLVVPSA